MSIFLLLLLLLPAMDQVHLGKQEFPYTALSCCRMVLKHIFPRQHFVYSPTWVRSLDGELVALGSGPGSGPWPKQEIMSVSRVNTCAHHKSLLRLSYLVYSATKKELQLFCALLAWLAQVAPSITKCGRHSEKLSPRFNGRLVADGVHEH